MSHRIRKMVAALLTSAVLIAGATPAFAYDSSSYQNMSSEARNRETPVLLDAMVFRPMGLILTMLGTVAMVPAGMFVGMTRPTEIGQPFELLVVNPFRYTFVDPLGEH